MNTKQMHIVERINDTMNRYPENIAICDGVTRITYKKLRETVENASRYLQERGLNREELVCIEVEKSIDLIVCVLSVLYAGGAYVLIDKDMPAARKNQIHKSIAPRFFIVDNEKTENDGQIRIDEIFHPATAKTVNVDRSLDQLVYVAFTSGSTGEAKGVEIEDYNVQSYCDAYIQQFNVTAEDKMLQLSKPSFDGFTEEVFVPLLCGAMIIIPDKGCERHPRLICSTVNKYQVTLCATTPLMLNEMNNSECVMPSLRVLISAGDILRDRYFDHLVKSTPIYNMYGPTETTVCVTAHKCTEDDDGEIPLGYALPNNKLYIVDDNCKEVENGMSGEILIVGDGVGRGYYRDPRLTSERFVSFKGERAYRTGDHAYCNESGEFVFIGRKDRQVKIRGFRVELLEIEKAALDISGVADVAVISDEVDEEKRIVMIYTSMNGIRENCVREILEERLPEYMIPRVIKLVATIPETDRGKRDVNAIALLAYSELHGTSTDNNQMEVGEKRFLDTISSKERRITFQDKPALIWDSISFISAIVALENEYGIVFDDVYLMLNKYTTVKEIYEYVESKR